MKLLTTLMLITLLMFSFTQDQAMAQGSEVRKAGLTASLQSDLMTILVPIWFGDMVTVAPGINFRYDDNVGTMLGLLVAPRFYIRMDRVAPYFGGALGVNIDMPDGPGGNLYDWNGRAAFGGEYFVNPMFSFGVEAQLNIFILDSARPGPSDFTVKTGAAVHANVYF